MQYQGMQEPSEEFVQTSELYCGLSFMNIILYSANTETNTISFSYNYNVHLHLKSWGQ